MTTEQINLRLDAETVAALERVAETEALDRAVIVRRLLVEGIRRWQRSHALASYQAGEISIGRAAEDAGVSVWEALELAREAGIAHPTRVEDVDEEIDALSRATDPEPEDGDATLADMPPARGGVLLVGVNPVHKSVAAGHYYQGAFGSRLWKRLQRLGLLVDPRPGAEDIAFTDMGHGLTDVVKRPTSNAREVSAQELKLGAAVLREKIARWQPGLVLFAFKQAATAVIGDVVKPGLGPPIGDAPTFLLTGPLAPNEQADEIDQQLAALLPARGEVALTQRVTDKDIANGRIRVPRMSTSLTKMLLPREPGKVQIVLRGRPFESHYNPYLRGDGREEKSGRIAVPAADLAELVAPDEKLRVMIQPGGVIKLD